MSSDSPQPAEPASKIDLPASVGGSGGEIPTFDVTLRIARFIPETDSEPHYEDYQVTMQGTDRVLDALHKIKWEIDGSLSFRRSCAHGVCGSDAMRINGRNRLACKTLLKDIDLNKPITVEAIKGLPLEKDLIVDMEPFFQSYREIMPFLVTSGHEPTRERIQSAEERQRFDDTTKCILCAACTSSCPVFLDRRAVLRPGRHRERAPVHLRLPRRGLRHALGDPQRQGRRLAVPDDVQLHRSVPARHPGDQGDLRSQASNIEPFVLTRTTEKRSRTPGAPPGTPAPAPSSGTPVAAQ